MKSYDRCEIFRLSQDTLSHLISLTSPKDACCCAAVSSRLNSASKSDVVWERFVPDSDLLSRFVDRLPPFSSKRELFLYLCDHDILMDNRSMTFRLERKSGAYSYMVRAKNLDITWSDSQYWQRVPSSDSRFGEVAILLLVWWLEVGVFFHLKELSPETMYASYLVFKLDDDSDGLEVPQKTFTDLGNSSSVHTVCLHPDDDEVLLQSNENIRIPNERQDGWMEMELGEFYVNKGDHVDPVHVGLREIETLYSKRGLIVEGIEIRPK